MKALMNLTILAALGCRVYATIRGWGISSDGSGGITRPEAQGQVEALRRAYRRRCDSAPESMRRRPQAAPTARTGRQKNG